MNKAVAHIYNKNQLSKWLLAAVLILSLFSYGGIASAVPGKSQVYHTALQGKLTYTVKKSVTYRSSFNRPSANTFLGDACAVKELSNKHTLSAKIQLIEHRAPYITVQTVSFFHHKIIADTSAEAPAILV